MADEDYLPIKQGDSLIVELEFDEPVDPEAPDGARQPTDMSAWTFASQWRSYEQNAQAIAFGIDASDAADGKVVMSMTGAQTATMLTDGVYDVQGTQGPPGSQVQTFWKERTVLELDVTRG